MELTTVSSDKVDRVFSSGLLPLDGRSSVGVPNIRKALEGFRKQRSQTHLAKQSSPNAELIIIRIC